MRKFRMIGAPGVLILGVGVAMALASPAHAAPVQPATAWELVDTAGDGTASGSAKSKIVDQFTVHLTLDQPPAPPHYGTSIETDNLGIEVKSGDKVTVAYELDEASAAAGAVRMFIYGKANANTQTEAPAQSVAAPDGPDAGTLTITVDFTGTIGTAGLVYDSSNGGVKGTVTFRNLTVAGEKVQFQAPPPPPPAPKHCEAYVYTGTQQNLCADFPTNEDRNCDDVKYRVTLPDYTKDPWGLDGAVGAPFDGEKGVGCETNPLKSAPGTPTSAAPDASAAPGAGGGLPVTGVDVSTLGVAGIVLVGVGAGLYTLARRRRVRTEV